MIYPTAIEGAQVALSAAVSEPNDVAVGFLFAAGVVSGESPERGCGTAPFESPAAIQLSNLGHGAAGEPQTGLPSVSSEPHETPEVGFPLCQIPSTPAPSVKVTDTNLARAHERQPVVEHYLRLLREGHGKRAAHRMLLDAGFEIAFSTLDSWAIRFSREGFPGLLDGHHRAGRPSAVKRLVAAVGQEAAESIFRDISGVSLDVNSDRLATRLVARGSAAHTALAEMVDYREDGKPRKSKQSIPRSIIAKIHANAALRRKHAGPRASELRGLYTPRQLDVLPGDVWTSDDTTPIWGWWVPWEHALGNPAYDTASCEYKFGVKLLQGQLLPLVDVASNYVFSLALIARETSGYRAADIWALFGRAFAQWGLPRLGVQFERGSWEANLIRGVEVTFAEGEPSHDRRVGGLRMLPTNICEAHRRLHGEDFNFPKTLQTWTSFLPKSKPVEAVFNRLQAVEGMLWGSLGRDQQRNPNEKAKKTLEACKRGSMDPRLHFLSVEELLARISPLYHFINTERMEGRVFRGVPKLLWEQSLRENPLYQMPAESQFLYRRTWQLARVTRGLITVKRRTEFDKSESHFFCNPEVFVGLEGKQVLAYWDEQDVQTPAQILDTNGAYLCDAEYQHLPGMFLDDGTAGHENRRRYRNALTTYYADLGARSPSRQLPQEIAIRRAQAGQEPRISRTPAEPTKVSNLAAYRPELAVVATPETSGAAADPRMVDFVGDDNFA